MAYNSDNENLRLLYALANKQPYKNTASHTCVSQYTDKFPKRESSLFVADGLPPQHTNNKKRTNPL